ncbi:MAG TPA: nuclear transport factor 2 family protein [Bryobacteraceae bacterium]|jgi:predicted SnoaL-like aldol condensation-catalyzing enzyme
MKIRFAVVVALAALGGGVVAVAQDPVKPSSDVEALFHDKNKKLNDMKQVAYHIEKELLQCNYWDQADKWLTQRYIQHNPNAGNGLAGVVKFFSSRKKSESCDKLTAPVVAVLADGDVVTVVTAAPRKDSKGESYTTTWFDMWRIMDGKADEHWDPATKP